MIAADIWAASLIFISIDGKSAGRINMPANKGDAEKHTNNRKGGMVVYRFIYAWNKIKWNKKNARCLRKEARLAKGELRVGMESQNEIRRGGG